MSAKHLMQAAERLESEISGANASTRLRLQPEFTRLLDRMRDEGEKVPERWRALDAALVDEAIEARFDNMPL